MFILKKISWFSLFLFFVTSVALASEKSLYDFSWLDKDKEIYVLQNRSFRKDGKLFVALNVGETVAKAYVEGMVGQARIGYFFKEDFGIEILTSKNEGKFNKLAERVRGQGVSVPYARIVDNYTAAQLVWSPFYSKINTFNKIFYYDWMFGLGYASITNSDNRNEFEAGKPRTLTEETNSGLIWSTGLRFYINQSWSMRIDYTALRYQANFFVAKETGEKEWFNNYDLTIGVNYTF